MRDVGFERERSSNKFKNGVADTEIGKTVEKTDSEDKNKLNPEYRTFEITIRQLN